MAADVLAVLLFIAMAGLGWYRGTLVQVATVIIATLLIGLFEAWYPPIDGALADLAIPLAEYPTLRKLVGFLGAYFLAVTAVAVMELASRRIGEVETVNRAGGVLIGAAKGVLYVVALAWFAETATLWDKPPREPRPSWMRESLVLKTVSPWNPVRVYTLKQAIEVKLARAELAKRDKERRGQGPRVSDGEPLDEAAAATTPDGKQGDEAAMGEVWIAEPLEESPRVRALYRASPMRALMDETASLSEWQGRGYGDLIRDPHVREMLGNANFADLLMGE